MKKRGLLVIVFILFTFCTRSAFAADPLLKDFKILPLSDQEVIVAGVINPTAPQPIGTLKVQFLWSKTRSFETSDPSDSRQVVIGVGEQTGIGAGGSYRFTINSLSPKTAYFFKQILLTTGNTTPLDIQLGTFNTGEGFVPEGSIAAQNAFDARSYHLLAPWPGLSVLMDPDLCAEMKAGPNPKLGKDAICDVNGFLNYAFKLLIGLTAVVLVLRLMYEGYQYMVTDVPFLKASAKGGFFTALTGLLLALSAYLILNTINPKLVDNRITIESVFVGVEPGNDGLGIESVSETEHKLTLRTKSGGSIVTTACNDSEMVQVNAFGTSFKIQKNLLPSIQRIDTKWRALNPAYKIPMTVEDKNSMGGFVCRSVAGKKKLSYHAYGLAVDINPSSNAQGKILKTDMPQSFINLWKQEGWGWGGEWTSSKDAMHFSKGTNEGGNMTVD